MRVQYHLGPMYHGSKLLSVLVVAAVLFSNLIMPAVGQAAAKTETVKFWVDFDPAGTWGVSVMHLITAFEKENPDVKVEVSHVASWKDFYDKLKVAVVSGSGPDIAHLDRNFVQEALAAKLGMLEPLDKIMTPENRKEAFVEPVLREITYENQLWAVPLFFDIRGLVWNNDLLDKVGLNSAKGPSDFRELNTYINRLTRFDAEQNVTQLGYPYLFTSWGPIGHINTFNGQIFDETGYPTMTHPNNVKALSWIRDLAQVTPFAKINTFGSKYDWDITRAFADNAVGLYPESSGVLSQVRLINPGINMSAGRHPYPEGGSNGGWIGGTSVVIPKGSSISDGTVRLINYLASSRAELMLFQEAFRLPPRKDTLGRVRGMITDKAMLAYLDQAEEQHPKPFFFSTLNTSIDKAIVGVASLQTTPEAALETAQKEVVAFLRDNRIIK